MCVYVLVFMCCSYVFLLLRIKVANHCVRMYLPVCVCVGVQVCVCVGVHVHVHVRMCACVCVWLAVREKQDGER